MQLFQRHCLADGVEHTKHFAWVLRHWADLHYTYEPQSLTSVARRGVAGTRWRGGSNSSDNAGWVGEDSGGGGGPGNSSGVAVGTRGGNTLRHLATGRVIWTGHQLALWGNVVIGGAPATTSTQSSVIHTDNYTVGRGAPAITSTQSSLIHTDNCCTWSTCNHITILCPWHWQLLSEEQWQSQQHNPLLFTWTTVVCGAPVHTDKRHKATISKHVYSSYRRNTEQWWQRCIYDKSTIKHWKKSIGVRWRTS